MPQYPGKIVRHYYDTGLLGLDLKYIGTFIFDPTDSSEVQKAETLKQTKAFRSAARRVSGAAVVGLQTAARLNPISQGIEIATGEDIITGDELSTFDKGVNVVAVVPVFGVLDKVNDARKIRKATGATGKTGHVAKTGVQANKAAGDAARDAIAAREAPALIERNRRVTGGLRRVDVLKQGNRLVAFESKVGRTGLGRSGSRVRQELARDIKLLRSGQVDEVVWEFTRSGVTGKIGPTQPLLDALNKSGITVKIN